MELNNLSFNLLLLLLRTRFYYVKTETCLFTNNAGHTEKLNNTLNSQNTLKHPLLNYLVIDLNTGCKDTF